MADKTTIQNLINTNLADASNILASEHRAVEDALLLNSYGTVVLEDYNNVTDATPNTTPFDADLWYQLRFVKQGRKVSVNGYLYNRSASIVTGEWLTFDASEYTPTTGTLYVNGVTNSGTVVRCRIANDKLYVDSSVGATTNVYLNFNYFTQD